MRTSTCSTVTCKESSTRSPCWKPSPEEALQGSNAEVRVSGDDGCEQGDAAYPLSKAAVTSRMRPGAHGCHAAPSTPPGFSHGTAARAARPHLTDGTGAPSSLVTCLHLMVTGGADAVTMGDSQQDTNVSNERKQGFVKAQLIYAKPGRLAPRPPAGEVVWLCSWC